MWTDIALKETFLSRQLENRFNHERAITSLPSCTSFQGSSISSSFMNGPSFIANTHIFYASFCLFEQRAEIIRVLHFICVLFEQATIHRENMEHHCSSACVVHLNDEDERSYVLCPLLFVRRTSNNAQRKCWAPTFLCMHCSFKLIEQLITTKRECSALLFRQVP
jgi:hypothetical protein